MKKDNYEIIMYGIKEYDPDTDTWKIIDGGLSKEQAKQRLKEIRKYCRDFNLSGRYRLCRGYITAA